MIIYVGFHLKSLKDILRSIQSLRLQINPNFVLLAFILLVTAFSACYFPPNNWDSMTYNLARVCHWIQNMSIELYPTHIDRQIYNPPLHEYAMMHVYILDGGDRFVNMVQWASYFHCIVLASLIGRQLGFSRSVQWLAALICAATPMLILQSGNTKNELTVSFFIGATVYYWLQFLQDKKYLKLLFTALCFGMAIATKGTALVFLFPIAGVVSLPYLRQNLGRIVLSGTLILVLATIICAPLFARNIKTYHHIIGGSESTRNYYKNEVFGVWVVFSNIIRNTAIHFGSGNTLGNKISSPIARNTQKIAERIHTIFHIDIVDSRTTWGGTKFELSPNRDEDYSGNLLHTLFLLLIPVSSLFYFRKLNHSGYFNYSLSLFVAFLLFCFYLKWQPWHSRLHCPLFVLSSPLIAGLFQFSSKNIRIFISILFFAASLSYIFRNDTRPLLIDGSSVFSSTRDEWMFRKKSTDHLHDYYRVSDFCKTHKIKRIGLYLDSDGWDYPFWAILKRNNPEIKIYHVNVGDCTPEDIKKANPVPEVEMVVSIVDIGKPEFIVKGKVYNHKEALKTMSIYWL